MEMGFQIREVIRLDKVMRGSPQDRTQAFIRGRKRHLPLSTPRNQGKAM